MRFNVAQLIKGPTGASREYDVHERVGKLDGQVELLEPVVGSVTLMRTSQGILVTGRLGTKMRAECRRCLEPYDADVVVELEEEFLPVVRIGDAPVDEVPEKERDSDLLIDADHILDLSEVLRQELWLAVPSDGVCRPDCSGLCAQCGGNLDSGECSCVQAPIDPRWAALQALVSDEPDSQERSD
jgi:uncharacterized protein